MLLPAVLSALGLTFSQLIAGTDSFLLPVIVIACGFLWPVVESFLFRSAARRSRSRSTAASDAPSELAPNQ
jgi:hypothetical protein